MNIGIYLVLIQTIDPSSLLLSLTDQQLSKVSHRCLSLFYLKVLGIKPFAKVCKNLLHTKDVLCPNPCYLFARGHSRFLSLVVFFYYVIHLKPAYQSLMGPNLLVITQLNAFFLPQSGLVKYYLLPYDPSQTLSSALETSPVFLSQK